MEETRRVAAIDCGTNSIRLLISDVIPGEGVLAMKDVERSMVITRLGQGVDRTGELNEAAVTRTLEAAANYQGLIETHGAETVRIAATSATRDASNRALFVDGMAAITGVVPEVITGREEAELSFLGAVSSLPTTLERPFLVVDIGGGSTEFVVGDAGVESAVSVDMGSVRVTERFGPEPWTQNKRAAAEKWIDMRIEEAAAVVDLRAARTVVGVAGTVTSLAALIAGVHEYSPSVTHGYQPSPKQWEEAAEFLVSSPITVKEALPVMPVGRADVIGGGALIWRQILRYLGALGEQRHPSDEAIFSPNPLPPAVVVSEHDILDGLALSLAGGSH